MVVLGGSGLVGSRVVDVWRDQLEVLAPRHAELDLVDAEALARFLGNTRPAAVLNLAAGAQVDASEAERGDRDGAVFALNAKLPGRLAALCRETGTHLVHVSTDYVFDGSQAERPYREEDPPNPLSWYAETKLIGEQRVLESCADACVVRIEMPFSGRPHPRSDFARACARRLEAGETIAGVTDQRVTPVFLDDAARALRLLLGERTSCLVHVAATDWTTPYHYARSIAERLGLDADLVQPTTFEAFARTRPAPRPRHSWLDTSRFAALFGPGVLRSFEASLNAWAEQLVESGVRFAREEAVPMTVARDTDA